MAARGCDDIVGLDFMSMGIRSHAHMAMILLSAIAAPVAFSVVTGQPADSFASAMVSVHSTPSSSSLGPCVSEGGTQGYTMAGADGGAFAFGSNGFWGSLPG